MSFPKSLQHFPAQRERAQSTRDMAREGLGPAAGVDGASASSLVSFAFVFNLLIGAGALAIPRPFAQTGFVLAAPFLACLCFLSLLTSLYMVETLVSVRLISQDPVGLRHAMGGKANPSSSAADAAARSEDEDLLLAGTNSINLSAPVEESGGRRRRQGASGDAPERTRTPRDLQYGGFHSHSRVHFNTMYTQSMYHSTLDPISPYLDLPDGNDSHTPAHTTSRPQRPQGLSNTSPTGSQVPKPKENNGT